MSFDPALMMGQIDLILIDMGRLYDIFLLFGSGYSLPETCGVDYIGFPGLVCDWLSGIMKK